MIRVRTLGQCAIQIDSLAVGPDAEMVFAVLLLLTLEPGKRIGRPQLLALLWPKVPAPRAAHCLRQTLYRLRTLGVPLAVDRTHVSLPPGAVDCDVDVVLRMRRADDIERVADGIGGPFLPGYAPTFSEPLRDWVERHRDLITAGARRVLVGAIAARKARAEWADVERLSHRCLAIDPLNEDATLALAEAAALHGGKSEAMSILDRYLREMGPTAREVRLPAMTLRRRIAEPELEFPLAPPLHVPFVGRSAEMATLTAALRSARGGAGSVHFIHGEPGIGKTRLLTEFSRAASLEGVRIAPALCQSSDARRPLSAFVDLVPKLMTMPGALGCSPQSHKYLRRLIEHHSSEAPPTPDSAEAAMLYANVRFALLDLLDAIASESPVVVSIEDVQWLDAASWDMMTEMAGWLQSRRILVLLTSREREPRLAQRGGPPEHITFMSLGPLRQSDADSLLTATVGGQAHGISDEFRAWCLTTCGGNPYYLSELALHGLARRGDFRIPPTLSALVAQRVARLRPVSRRVLQACAILGTDATVDRIEQMLAQRRIELLDGLDELDQKALISLDESQIICRHDLLSQAAIAGLSPLSRRLLHQHAARVLETAAADASNPTLAWRSVEHWTLGGAPERAITLACQCARQAIEVGRPHNAIELLRRTKDLLIGKRGRVEVTTELLYAYRAADRWQDATLEFADLRAIRADSDSGGFTHDDTELIGIESQWLAGFATPDILAQLLDCCRSIQAHADHRVAAAKLCLIIADNTRDASTAHHAFNLVRTEVGLEPGQDTDRLEARLIFETSFGDRETATAALDALIRTAQRSPTRSRAFSLILAAHASERLGFVNRVVEIAGEAYRLAVECSCATAAAAAARKLAWSYLDEANHTLAEDWYKRAVDWVDKGQLSSFSADLYGLQAELLIGHQDYQRAEEALANSTAAWRRTVHTRWRLGVLSAQCAIWLATGQRNKCESVADEYRELLTSVDAEEGNDFLVARYIRLLASVDRAEDARDQLQRYLRSRKKPPTLYGAALNAVINELLHSEAADTPIATPPYGASLRSRQ